VGSVRGSVTVSAIISSSVSVLCSRLGTDASFVSGSVCLSGSVCGHSLLLVREEYAGSPDGCHKGTARTRNEATAATGATPDTATTSEMQPNPATAIRHRRHPASDEKGNQITNGEADDGPAGQAPSECGAPAHKR